LASQLLGEPALDLKDSFEDATINAFAAVEEE